MKFGKSLSNQIEGTFPEWRDKFLSYKELKQKLKLIESNTTTTDRSAKRLKLNDHHEFADVGVMSNEEFDFTMLLEAEVEKFNGFFEEKEEEYIITLKEFKDSVAKAKESSEELIKIRKEIVNFHGEMILLENYSAFNYTGLVKILKKYDKRTGALLRLPFIQKVLQEPFFTMDLLYRLIKECEIMLDQLFPIYKQSVDGDADPASTENEGLLNVLQETTEVEHMDILYLKSAVSALRILKETRKGSSTVSVFSLPPLQSNVMDESWNKIPVLEQVAK